MNCRGKGGREGGGVELEREEGVGWWSGRQRGGDG